MKDDERADSGRENASSNDRIAKRLRIAGDVAAGAVLALKVSAKIAGAAARWFMTKPLTRPAARSRDFGQNDSSRAEESGRVDDRNLTLEKQHQLIGHLRRGTFVVLCAFAVSVAGGFGFLWTYWTGGNNQLLGFTLASFLGGAGVAMVVWAHQLTTHKEASEPREQLDSSFENRQSAATQFEMGAHEIHRRSLLCWMSVIGLGFFATMVVSLLRSFGFNPYLALPSTVWKQGQRLVTNDGKPISLSAMPPGSTAIVFPEGDTDSERSQTVLIRVHPSMLQLPADRADWAPQGYVAYSRVCTHAGCVVGLYETTAHMLLCPCHQSTFDILRAAQPTSGPAARPLPQLPLYADNDGFLRAGGGFSEYPGPGYWGIQR